LTVRDCRNHWGLEGPGLGLLRGIPGGEQVIRREHDDVAGGGTGTGYGQQWGAVVGTGKLATVEDEPC
jgi:hypothetical protein